MRLLILLALAVVASADVGMVGPTCSDPNGILYMARREANCLHLHKEPKDFKGAFETCRAKKSWLLKLLPRTRKINFVNSMLVDKLGNDTTAWFTHPANEPQEPTKITDRMVIIPSQDPEKLKIVLNDTEVARPFICESSARPAAERPQFLLQPEDVQISNDVVTAFRKNATKEEIKQRPKAFTITFHCRAFSLPKPKLSWAFVSQNVSTGKLTVEEIQASPIKSLREALNALKVVSEKPESKFFNFQRGCPTPDCKPDPIMENSELIVVNPQLLDLHRRIACVARNAIGSVLSREAAIIVNHMADFEVTNETVQVEAGKNVTLRCQLDTEPEATGEWLREVQPKSFVRVQSLGRLSLGNLQPVRSTADLFIDAATPQDSGRYVCRVLMHNGRYHFVHREKTVDINVTRCTHGCKLDSKPVQVLNGYPTVMSLNPMSRELIRYGDAFLLECPCSGKRDPRELLHVEWKTPLQRYRQLRQLPQRSAIIFEQAGPRDSGEYACRCMRGLDASEWRSINVTVTPLFAPLSLPDIVVVKAGETAEISCQMPTGHYKGWYKSVLPMKDTVSIFDKLKVEKDPRFSLTDKDEKYTITIRKVTTKDSGVYGFRVNSENNELGVSEADTYFTRLRVE